MTTSHLGNSTDYKACWGRSSDYRKKAMQGIKAKPDRQDIYDNEQLLQVTLSMVSPRPLVSGNGQITPLTAGCQEHIARYKLSEFTSGSKPYPNHAHHMIPANAFLNRFTSKQQEILRQIDYDVNNGNNLIYLPSQLLATRYHLLPWHQTDDFHRSYSKEVKDAATKIEDKVDELIAAGEPCEIQDPPKNIVAELVEYENLLWKVIVNLGPKSINEIKIPKNKDLGGLT